MSKSFRVFRPIIRTSLCLPLVFLAMLPSAHAIEPHEVETSTSISDTPGDSWQNRLNINYYGILYGPSITEPTSFQTTPNGRPDRTRTLLVKNFGTLAYGIDESLSVSGTAYWYWRPVRGQAMQLKDPYLRVAKDPFLTWGSASLYSDLRVHLPVTAESRAQDLLAGLQTFHILNVPIGSSRFSAGAYGSARVNLFGSLGYGDDLELYLGPVLNYTITPTLTANLLYEMGMSHPHRGEAFVFNNDGTDIAPGLTWAITPQVIWNPYLVIYPAAFSARNTALGMTLSVNLL